MCNIDEAITISETQPSFEHEIFLGGHTRTFYNEAISVRGLS